MKNTWLISAVLLLVALSTGLVVANNRAGDGETCIVVSPQTLVLSEKNTSVTIHSNIVFSTVQEVSLTLTQNGAAVPFSNFRIWQDDIGDLAARFNLAVEDVDPNVKTLTLTLTVTDDSGTYDVFTVITVKEDYSKDKEE